MRKLQGVIDETGLELVEIESPSPWEEIDTDPTAVIVGIGAPGWVDLIAGSKAHWPLAMLVGVLTLPDQQAWADAEDAGCHLVTTRGALRKVLPARLAAWQKGPGGRKLRLFALADIAGRLGLVLRLDDETTGPVAVYHIGKDVVAVQDLCPHAGAMLSNGEVDADDGIVTCPEHGSRFDTRSGERLRGPADIGLRTFPVVIEDGQAYLQIASS
ncbi:MAG: Rieske 2Fe-2S domain-containing protein [Actinomycetota bacterium]|nr:Rieske 2Fe-2S domain-containing protein [Actinomycetota bacterium]